MVTNWHFQIIFFSSNNPAYVGSYFRRFSGSRLGSVGAKFAAGELIP